MGKYKELIIDSNVLKQLSTQDEKLDEQDQQQDKSNKNNKSTFFETPYSRSTHSNSNSLGIFGKIKSLVNWLTGSSSSIVDSTMKKRTENEYSTRSSKRATPSRPFLAKTMMQQEESKEQEQDDNDNNDQDDWIIKPSAFRSIQTNLPAQVISHQHHHIPCSPSENKPLEKITKVIDKIPAWKRKYHHDHENSIKKDISVQTEEIIKGEDEKTRKEGKFPLLSSSSLSLDDASVIRETLPLTDRRRAMEEDQQQQQPPLEKRRKNRFSAIFTEDYDDNDNVAIGDNINDKRGMEGGRINETLEPLIKKTVSSMISLAKSRQAFIGSNKTLSSANPEEFAFKTIREHVKKEFYDILQKERAEEQDKKEREERNSREKEEMERKKREEMEKSKVPSFDFGPMEKIATVTTAPLPFTETLSSRQIAKEKEKEKEGEKEMGRFGSAFTNQQLPDFQTKLEPVKPLHALKESKQPSLFNFNLPSSNFKLSDGPIGAIIPQREEGKEITSINSSSSKDNTLQSSESKGIKNVHFDQNPPSVHQIPSFSSLVKNENDKNLEASTRFTAVDNKPVGSSPVTFAFEGIKQSSTGFGFGNQGSTEAGTNSTSPFKFGMSSATTTSESNDKMATANITRPSFPNLMTASPGPMLSHQATIAATTDASKQQLSFTGSQIPSINAPLSIDDSTKIKPFFGQFKSNVTTATPLDATKAIATTAESGNLKPFQGIQSKETDSISVENKPPSPFGFSFATKPSSSSSSLLPSLAETSKPQEQKKSIGMTGNGDSSSKITSGESGSSFLFGQPSTTTTNVFGSGSVFGQPPKPTIDTASTTATTANATKQSGTDGQSSIFDNKPSLFNPSASQSQQQFQLQQPFSSSSSSSFSIGSSGSVIPGFSMQQPSTFANQQQASGNSMTTASNTAMSSKPLFNFGALSSQQNPFQVQPSSSIQGTNDGNRQAPLSSGTSSSSLPSFIPNFMSSNTQQQTDGPFQFTSEGNLGSDGATGTAPTFSMGSPSNRKFVIPKRRDNKHVRMD